MSDLKDVYNNMQFKLDKLVMKIRAEKKTKKDQAIAERGNVVFVIMLYCGLFEV